MYPAIVKSKSQLKINNGENKKSTFNEKVQSLIGRMTLNSLIEQHCYLLFYYSCQLRKVTM